MDDTGATYFVIGGGGFMGSAFARHLEAGGNEVVRVLRGDSLDDTTAAALRRGTARSIVVDFAYTSVPNSSFDDPVGDYSNNLYNLLRHAEFARRLPNPTYVYVSSGGTVYGNPLRPAPIDEDHRNIPLAPYGITKLACERYALMYHHVHGLDLRIVRPSNVYGPGQIPFRGQGVVATMLARLIAGEGIRVFGDGSITRDYLYVDDFCAAMDDVISLGINGEIYNVGSGVGVTIAALVERMQVCLDRAVVDIERAPTRPFDVQYNVLDSQKLRTLNHWRPRVDLDDGLGRSAAWLAARARTAGG